MRSHYFDEDLCIESCYESQEFQEAFPATSTGARGRGPTRAIAVLCLWFGYMTQY